MTVDPPRVRPRMSWVVLETCLMGAAQSLPVPTHRPHPLGCSNIEQGFDRVTSSPPTASERRCSRQAPLAMSSVVDGSRSCPWFCRVTRGRRRSRCGVETDRLRLQTLVAGRHGGCGCVPGSLAPRAAGRARTAARPTVRSAPSSRTIRRERTTALHSAQCRAGSAAPGQRAVTRLYNNGIGARPTTATSSTPRKSRA